MNNFFKKHNPYFIAILSLLSRISWDMSYQSFSSRRKIKKMQNTMTGKKVIILCNGPSLNKVNFEDLKDTKTIALNKFNLKKVKSRFSPNYLVAVNDLVVQQNKHYFEMTDVPLFLSHRAVKFINKNDNMIFLHGSGIDGFAEDCSFSISEGYTVTYVAIQLAFHLGFTKVGLVGCDHSYKFTGKPNEKTILAGDDVNHFDKDYFGGGLEWHNPDLLESERAYLLAKKHFVNAGREIINCTEGGNLEIFPRQNLDDFLSN